MTFALVTEKYVSLDGGPGQTLTIRPTRGSVSVFGEGGLIGVYDPADLQGAFDAAMALMAELYPPDQPPKPKPATP